MVFQPFVYVMVFVLGYADKRRPYFSAFVHYINLLHDSVFTVYIFICPPYVRHTLRHLAVVLDIAAAL
jgi:hypothetical protein